MNHHFKQQQQKKQRVNQGGSRLRESKMTLRFKSENKDKSRKGENRRQSRVWWEDGERNRKGRFCLMTSFTFWKHLTYMFSMRGITQVSEISLLMINVTFERGALKDRNLLCIKERARRTDGMGIGSR